MKCSRRSSVNLTGRPSSRAAHGTSTSSGHGCTILTPNPPPTSGVITSTSARARPSLAATAARTPVEVWVEVQIRSRRASASQPASTPRPSSGVDADRSMYRSSSSTCGAAAIAAAASPCSCTGVAGHVAGHVGVDQVLGRAGGVEADHGGQRLVARPRSGRPRPRPGSGRGRPPSTTASPTWLTSSVGQRVGGPAVGERRVRDQQRQRLGEPARQVLVGVDGDQPVHVERVADVDVEDPRVGVRAAHERGRERVVARGRRGRRRGRGPAGRPRPAGRWRRTANSWLAGLLLAPVSCRAPVPAPPPARAGSPPRAAPPPRCSGSRCTGTGCRRSSPGPARAPARGWRAARR